MEKKNSELPVGRPIDAFSYWKAASNPGHRHSSPWWSEFYAKELLLYFPDLPASVLECGCGTGLFFPWFKDRCKNFVGVDFSESMLARFRSDWPHLKLICADAAYLPVGNEDLMANSFDFIFSNQVCQFFDDKKLRAHLLCIGRLLAPGGRVLIGNVPDAQLRLHFYAGALRAEQRSKWLRGLTKLLFANISGRDGIGHWYTRNHIAAIAGEMGFECKSFSSASLEYRFHLLLLRA